MQPRPSTEDFDERLAFVIRWLLLNSNFFTDNPDEADSNECVRYTKTATRSLSDDRIKEQRRQNQRYLLFVGAKDGEVVAAGWVQLGKRNFALQKLGVRTAEQHSGVGKAMFKWIFGALPRRHAMAKVVLGVFKDNGAMIGFMRRLGATDLKGKHWDESETEERAVFLRLYPERVAAALNIELSQNRGYYRFSEPTVVDGVTFRALYFGHPPERITPRETIVIGEL